MVARLLNLAGLDLGDPARFLDPQTDNPLGFWENREIMDLNDRILAHQGGSWMKPPLWQSGWESTLAISAFSDEARDILDRAYNGRGASQWGWKDPRTTLTLPFWKRLLGSLRLVLVIRNPVDVARSLEARHGWSLQVGINLWKQYVDIAFVHGAGLPMCVTIYDDFFEDPARETRRLLEFCELSIDIDESQLLDTIQRDHRHHRTHRQELLSCRECSDNAKDIYFWIQRRKDDIQSRSFHSGFLRMVAEMNSRGSVGA